MGIITMGNSAKLILKCTDMFRAKKNWNSHGASVGNVICQLASILSQMQAASVNELNHNLMYSSHREMSRRVQNTGITMFVTSSTCVVNLNPGLWEIWRCI